jgi:hypothetical protein
MFWSVLSGGKYRRTFDGYANKGRAMREGLEKRAHRRFRTSKRIWSGLSKPIGVEFDELCLYAYVPGIQDNTSSATNEALDGGG